VARPTRPPKKELIEVISEALLDGKVVQRFLRKLSERERMALDALIAADGRLPYESYQKQFGEIRPFRPRRKDEPSYPSYDSNQPAQQLAYWGLAYLHPRRPKPGQRQEVIIPHDLLALLPPVQSAADAAATSLIPVVTYQESLLFDITMLLCFVHQQQPKAIYNGRCRFALCRLPFAVCHCRCRFAPSPPRPLPHSLKPSRAVPSS
jgi:hypothetical protein